MPDDIKNRAYYDASFQLLDQSLAETTAVFAQALPLDPQLTSLIPWQQPHTPLPPIPPGLESRAAEVLSISFEILNLVEEHTGWLLRSQRRRTHGPSAIKGLWPSVIKRLHHDGLTEDQALQALRDVHIEPVLTAHPTEAKRPSVREKHLTIYQTIRDYQREASDPHHGRRLADTLAASFESLWHTGEIFVQRPSIQEELRNAIHYLREVFPSTLLRMDRSLELAWADVGWNPENLRSANAYPRLRFSTWIGGDRDGHPFVTPETTEDTLATLRHHAILLHRQHLRSSAEELTLAPPFVKVPAELTQALDDLTETLGDPARAIRQQNQNEPWRAYLYLLREKLQHLDTPRGYTRLEDYQADLDLAHRTLLEANSPRTAHEWIRPLQRLAQVFGFHLAALDIRNNSEAHDEAAAEIFASVGIPDAANFPQWPEEKRRELLISELKNPRPLLPRYAHAGERANPLLAYFRVVATHLRKYGPQGLGQFVISMTRSVSDLLLVQVLAREAGLAQMQENGLWRSKIPVSPLFETGADLDASAAILDDYLTIMGPHPSGLQPAMVGYSDSNKDTGVFSSQWGIFKGQQAMTAICQKHQVTPQFFHGRGGTIGRGAGPTQWFLRALPTDSLTGPIRITEQGEVLPRKYAHEGNAHYHLEMLTAGVTRITGLRPSHRDVLEKCQPLLDQLQTLSARAYRDLLESPDFITFHRSATPIDALESGTFGSRPSRRTGKKATLQDLRAIPWVFSWTQSRFYLPGWFGVGSGLSQLDPADFELIRQSLDDFPFLTYVLTNVESSLASVNLHLMADYADLCPDPQLRQRIMETITREFELTRRLVADLLGADFETRRPRMHKTLALREEPLRLLHAQQISLLRSWRAEGSPTQGPTEGRHHPTFLALQLTINAISSGLRETG